MSALTSQEIRNRLAKVEITVAEIHEEITSGGVADANTLTALLHTKATVLNAAAITLLVEQQQTANELAAAAVYVSLGDLSLARGIVEKVRRA